MCPTGVCEGVTSGCGVCHVRSGFVCSVYCCHFYMKYKIQ